MRYNDAFIDKLNGFLQLEHNWDSYGAEPISPKSVEGATSFIRDLGWFGTPVYYVGPGKGGDVSVELKVDERALEFGFYPDQTIKYSRLENREFIDEGVYVLNQLESLRVLLQWLND